MSQQLIYNATQTGSAFHADRSAERWVIGPVGAGKTVMGCMEMYNVIVNQAPDPTDNTRYTRGLVIRESFPQLKTTTIKTWMEWFGQVGVISGQSPIKWTCKMKLPDGTYIDSEILFYALADGFDASKLRSLELTFVYLSEFAEISSEILDVASTRLRYPATKHASLAGYDYGPTWLGIFGESNAPAVTSHWYERFEVDRPEGCSVYKQPAPLIRVYPDGGDTPVYEDNPHAENIAALPGGFQYYHNMIKGMSDEAIDTLVLNQYGRDVSGKPVFPQFRADKSVVYSNAEPNPNYVVTVGMDFGLNPAAVFTQVTPTGALIVLDELTAEGVMFQSFVDEQLIPLLRHRRYHGCKIEIIGDPAGLSRNAMASLNPFQYLRSKGLAARQAKTNSVRPRIRAVESFIHREGGLLVSHRCPTLIEGLNGGYRYKKIKGAGAKAYRTEPDKNEYSHIADALQYAAVEYHDAMALRAQRKSGRRKPIGLSRGRQYG